MNLLDKYRSLSLRGKIGTVLVTFGVLGLLNFLSVAYFRSTQKLDTAVVDAAGRQRMLSQRAAFYAERVVRGQSKMKAELSSVLMLCDSSLKALKFGGVAPGIADNIQLPATSSSILPMLSEAEVAWTSYKANADILIESSAGTDHEKAIQYIESNAQPMLGTFNALVKAYVNESQSKQIEFGWVMIVLFLLNGLFIWMGFLVTTKYLKNPLLEVLNHAFKLSKGQIGDYQYSYKSSDEIGQAVRALIQFDQNLIQASEFAERIGKGDFSSEYNKAGEHDKLGSSLLEMRDKLRGFSTEEKKRTWSTNGMAHFSDILRSYQDNLKDLTQKVIKEVVSYLKVNQGTLFLVNDDSEEEPFMELMATYAWDRHKYLSKSIQEGHGVVGQVWLEGRTYYMTEVPQDYIRIRSGLGSAVPNCICIVPLKVDEKVLGILELASFQELEKYQIEFLEKLSESIAATFESTRVTERTRTLLEMSQQQTEAMRAQEEEMRQNQEELQSTQEEMERQKAELETEIIRLKEELAKVNIMNE